MSSVSAVVQLADGRHPVGRPNRSSPASGDRNRGRGSGRGTKAPAGEQALLAGGRRFEVVRAKGADLWWTLTTAYIINRGRKLVGMPLADPPLALGRQRRAGHFFFGTVWRSCAIRVWRRPA